MNPATMWAETFVAALVASGVRVACVAPGSRSTPLTLALAAQPGLRVLSHLDERSAGFFGLGLGLATGQPAVLVCTSGTAVANFLPAIVEARMSQVPLLVLTADRPPELRHSGANQTIDQVKIYGDQVLWSVDAPLPQADAPDVALRHLRSLAARAVATATGLPAGPVHVNFPFRKPLEPAGATAPPLAGGVPRISRGTLILSRAQESALAEIMNRHPRGLIVCGPGCPGSNFPAAVAGLAQVSGYAILADPLSGVRFGPHVAGAAVLGGYESYLQAAPPWPEPQVILRFGAVPTSRWLHAYLDRVQPRHHVHVRESGVWADDSHRTGWFLQADAEQACYQLAQAVTPRLSAPWPARLQAADAAAWAALEAALPAPYFDGAAVADVVELAPAGARLFAGNSLPVRHLDQFGRPRTAPLAVYGNRGASGIDGNISTALGIAAAGPAPLVAVLGDITFYHDLNGLLAAGRHNLGHVTLVLLHNNGGGIFRRLPVAHFDPPFTELFLTPHGLDFSGALQTYGLAHARVRDRAAFRDALATAVREDRPWVVELVTDGAQDEARRRQAAAAAQAAVQAAMDGQHE